VRVIVISELSNSLEKKCMLHNQVAICQCKFIMCYVVKLIGCEL